jgi:hypothetical protein
MCIKRVVLNAIESKKKKLLAQKSNSNTEVYFSDTNNG